MDGGPTPTGANRDSREDDASVITGGFSMTKSLFSTSLPESTDPYVLIGEEATSDRASDTGITWTVDPVDGTWNFASGIHPKRVSRSAAMPVAERGRASFNAATSAVASAAELR